MGAVGVPFERWLILLDFQRVFPYCAFPVIRGWVAVQSHQEHAGVADAGELQAIESELAAEEARLNALSGRRDDLMQRRAAALADKQRCGERCAPCSPPSPTSDRALWPAISETP